VKHPCIHCGTLLDPAAPGSYREIRGWEQVRRGGGAHAVTLREETGRVACSPCITLARAGISIQQLRLPL
jgi:hypothetical protein